MKSIEEFLIKNEFELYTYYYTNKRYRKVITEHEILYVRIYSDVNTIQEVEYENLAFTKFDTDRIVSFEKVNTLTKLKRLLKALL